MRGYIASMPDSSDTDPQFEFDTVERAAGVPSRIRLAWYDTAQWPAAGERWQFVVRLKRRNGFANPGGFDYEGLLFRSGIGATGYVRADVRNVRLNEASWRYGILRLRAWLAARIALATHDRSQLGVLQGLAVGQTQAMTAEQWRVFAATGTTHLMAISGLHISMVATLLAWLGGRLVWLPGAQRRGWTAVRGKASLGVLGAIGYSCLAGLSVPTQRTLIMLCVFFAARWYRRELSIGNALGLSLIAILLFDPFAPLAVGAWLSFVAVAVILLAVGGQLGRAGALRSFTHVQLAVTIGMAPLVIAAFSTLSLISPVANAIAVPLFTIVLVPLVLIGTLLATFSLPAGGMLLGLATKLLGACWPALEWLASQPLAVWHVPSLPLPVFVALLAGAWLLIVPAIWPVRAAALLLCMPAVLQSSTGAAAGEFELAVLDVGQGLAVSVRTQTHTAGVRHRPCISQRSRYGRTGRAAVSAQHRRAPHRYADGESRRSRSQRRPADTAQKHAHATTAARAVVDIDPQSRQPLGRRQAPRCRTAQTAGQLRHVSARTALAMGWRHFRGTASGYRRPAQR